MPKYWDRMISYTSFALIQFGCQSILEQNHTTRRKGWPITSITIAGQWLEFCYRACLAGCCAVWLLPSTYGGSSSYNSFSSSSSDSSDDRTVLNMRRHQQVWLTVTCIICSSPGPKLYIQETRPSAHSRSLMTDPL